MRVDMRIIVHNKRWQIIPQKQWHDVMASIPVGECVTALPYAVSPGTLELQVPLLDRPSFAVLDRQVLPTDSTFKVMRFRLTTVDLDEGATARAWQRVA